MYATLDLLIYCCLFVSGVWLSEKKKWYSAVYHQNSLSDGKAKQWKYSKYSIHLINQWWTFLRWLKYVLLLTQSTATAQLPTPILLLCFWGHVAHHLLRVIRWLWISTSHNPTSNTQNYSFTGNSHKSGQAALRCCGKWLKRFKNRWEVSVSISLRHDTKLWLP